MITEDYVSFEIAKLLKEKGFDESTSMVYMSYDHLCKLNRYDSIRNSNYNDITKNYFEYTAPTLQMAMKWLRKVHNIHIELNWDKGNQLYSFQIWKPGKYKPEISSLDLWRIYKDDNHFGEWIYEQACEAAIKYCLENLI